MSPSAVIAQIIGNGSAVAVNPEGGRRLLAIGDRLRHGETLRTAGDVRIELVFPDGRSLLIEGEDTVRIDDSVVGGEDRPTAQDSALREPAITTRALIETLERGTDPAQALKTASMLPPSDAGPGGEGSTGFVNLTRLIDLAPPSGNPAALEPAQPVVDASGDRVPDDEPTLFRALDASDDRALVGLGGTTTLQLLANDRSSDPSAVLTVTHVGAVAFRDLMTSADPDFPAAEGFRQVTLDHGVAFLKQDGTFAYRHEGRRVIVTPEDDAGTFQRLGDDGSVQTFASGEPFIIGFDDLAAGRLRYLPAAAEVGTPSSAIATLVEITSAADRLDYTLGDGSRLAVGARVDIDIRGEPLVIATVGDNSGGIGSGATDQDRDGIPAHVESLLASRVLGITVLGPGPYTLTLGDLLRPQG